MVDNWEGSGEERMGRPSVALPSWRRRRKNQVESSAAPGIDVHIPEKPTA